MLVLSIISTLSAAQAAPTMQAAPSSAVSGRPAQQHTAQPSSPSKPGNVQVATTVSFTTHVDYAVGTSPQSIAVADLDYDGKPDFLTANANDNTVSVRHGVGSGVFGAESIYSVGNAPVSVALGDFDQDGYADLVTANRSASNVSVRLGDGSGGFGAESRYPAGPGPFAVAVGDFNGNDDIVTANFYSNSVTVLLGSGGGSFSPPVSYPIGGGPQSVAVGYFNNDANADLVAANSPANTISVLLGDGSGGFGPNNEFPVGSYPAAVAVGDFNGDGKSDLVTANLNDGTVSVLFGTGNGGFGAASNFAVGNHPQSVAVGDFNGDGKLDLVTANFGDNTVSVLLGDGIGHFGTANNFAVGALPISVAVADFNNDGKPDLATANYGSGNVSVLLNISAPPATPTITPTAITTPAPTNTPGGPTPTDCANPFVDVSGNIFYPAIHYLYCRSVVNGTDATHFSPHGSSTRAQFAKVVVLGFGTPSYTPASPDFTDVPPSFYAYLFIESGFHAGILSGFDAAGCTSHGATYPCYLPNLPITRAQLTKLVVNAAHYPLYTPTGGNPTFSDVPPSNVFFASIETAHNKGIINGYPGGVFLPNQAIQRDQMCQIVYKGVTTP